MEFNKQELDATELMESITIQVKITGVTRLTFKLKIATFLINIASWIIRPGKFEIELKD